MWSRLPFGMCAGMLSDRGWPGCCCGIGMLASMRGLSIRKSGSKLSISKPCMHPTSEPQSVQAANIQQPDAMPLTCFSQLVRTGRLRVPGCLMIQLQRCSQGVQPRAKTASEALRNSAGHWADHAEMPLADVHTLLLHPGMADLHGLQELRLQLTSQLECTATHQSLCGASTMQIIVMRLQDKSVEPR